MIENQNSTTAERQIKFYGDGGKLFGIYILNMFLTIITLGIYSFWAKTEMRKYIYQETELEGSRFQYHGTGLELFIGFLKAMGIIVAFYIVFFLVLFIFKSEVLAVLCLLLMYVGIICLTPVVIHSALKYRTSRTSWRGIHFGYRGNVKEFVKLFLINSLLTIITIGFYASWMRVKLRTYVLEHLRFGSITFKFKGSGEKLFLINLKGLILTILTLGIYSFWYMKEVYEFEVNNTEAYQNDEKIDFKFTATGGELFGLLFVNMLLIMFTFGLATPWVIIRTYRFTFSKISITGNFNPDAIQQTEAEYKDATGDDLSSMLDIGSVI